MLELSPLSMGSAGKARGASTEARCTVSSEKVNVLENLPRILSLDRISAPLIKLDYTVTKISRE